MISSQNSPNDFTNSIYSQNPSNVGVFLSGSFVCLPSPSPVGRVTFVGADRPGGPGGPRRPREPRAPAFPEGPGGPGSPFAPGAPAVPGGPGVPGFPKKRRVASLRK